MTTYNLHLGFNWYSPQIGTLFRAEGPLEARFLQIALEHQNNTAASFARDLQVDDILNTYVHCLNGWEPTITVNVTMAFGPVNYASDPDPETLDTYPPHRIVSGGDVSYYEESHETLFVPTASKPIVASPWPVGGAYGSWALQPLQVVSTVTDAPIRGEFELGVSVAADLNNGSPLRTFIGDPEVIVGGSGSGQK